MPAKAAPNSLIRHTIVMCLLLITGLLTSACSKKASTARAFAKTYETAKQEDSSPLGMVVSAHPLASAVGKKILQKGGSAADAAIAVQFALAVVCPRAGNLGGGGFWVTAPAGDAVQVLDYREKAPSAAHKDMYLDANGEPITNASLLGAKAAGIPGQVDGMWLAYTFGSTLKNWPLLLEDAIELAEKGFPITAAEAKRLNRYREDFISQNPFPFPFVKATPWKEGDILQQETLARTLQKIASEGPNYFYSGAFADSLSMEVRARGGIWTSEDLSGYGSVFRKRVEADFDGYSFYSVPPPSSGGLLMGQMLGMLDGYDLAATARQDSVAYFHLLIEAMRRAYADRSEWMGDPDFVAVPLDSLLDREYLKRKWSSFDPDRATASPSFTTQLRRDVYETTHTSVVDKNGNAVAVTTTINGNYGSKVWSKVGGFFLNNEMDDFSQKPGHPDQFGLVGGMANAIQPGKRMVSSMTPTIVRRGDDPVLILGSPGGSTIITAVLQVSLNHLVHGLPLAESVAKPRIHHQYLPDEVLYEPGAFSAEVRKALEAKGHKLREVQSLGLVKAISRKADQWIGVGDPRNPDDTAMGLQP